MNKSPFTHLLVVIEKQTSRGISKSLILNALFMRQSATIPARLCHFISKTVCRSIWVNQFSRQDWAAKGPFSENPSKCNYSYIKVCNPKARVKYQKSNSGGPEHNVTDSEGENGLQVKINVPKTEWESKSGELVSTDPNITDVWICSMKQTRFKDRQRRELAWRSVSSEHSKRVKETVAKLVNFRNNPDSHRSNISLYRRRLKQWHTGQIERMKCNISDSALVLMEPLAFPALL